MKIAFVTLGCKLNYAETSTYERGFIAAGLEVVGWRQKADLYLVNTCTVTHTSNSKSRSEIRKLHRINPDARIIVTGCYAQMNPDEVAAIEGVWKVFGASRKSSLVSECLEELGIHSGNGCSAPGKSGADSGIGAAGAGGATGVIGTDGTPVVPGAKGADRTPGVNGGSAVFGAFSSGERTRSFLKVQDGCDNFCAYCTVPFARGRSRNIPICEAVAMAREIASKGIKEIVLTGVNTGDFGRSTGESFLDLLKALNQVDGIERYRISSIEPNLLTEEIIDWIASGTKFQPHFHIPLQTGTDVLLQKMGRRYDTAFFEARLDRIRKALEAPGKPKVFFGIDVMVGLPGENEELFARTKAFLERIAPAFIHIFPYSPRPGTRAASMPDQIDDRIKARRVKELEEMCSRLHSSVEKEHEGMRMKVLFETSEKNGMMAGYTENYIRVTRPYDPLLAGKIVDVIL